MATYEALSTRIDLNGLADLVEMRHVRDSWRHAEMFEADYQRDLAAEQRAMQGAAKPKAAKPKAAKPKAAKRGKRR